jgi:hypothetical protein
MGCRVTSGTNRPVYRRIAPLATMLVIMSAGAWGQSAPTVAGGESRDWWVGLGASHTDNAALVGTGTVADTIENVSGGIHYAESDPRIQALLAGTGQYLHYDKGTFGDEFLGNGVGHLGVGIVPERIVWTVDDTFGQAAIDPSVAFRPTNLQNVNTASTGFQLRPYFGSDAHIELTAQAGESRYEQTKSLDNNFTNANLGFVRQVSPSLNWSLNADATHLVYQVPGDPTYDREEAFLRLQQIDARQDKLTLDAGATAVRGFGQRDQSPLLRLNWEHHLTASLRFIATGDVEYQSTADQVGAAVRSAPQEFGPQSVVPTELIHRIESIGAGIHFERVRTTLGLDASYGQETYLGTGQDASGVTIATRKVTSVRAVASRRFTQRLTGVLDGSYVRHQSQQLFYDDNLKYYNAHLSWHLGRGLFLDAGYRHDEQDFGIATNSYRDNIEYLSINYRPYSKAL